MTCLSQLLKLNAAYNLTERSFFRFNSWTITQSAFWITGQDQYIFTGNSLTWCHVIYFCSLSQGLRKVHHYTQTWSLRLRADPPSSLLCLNGTAVMQIEIHVQRLNKLAGVNWKLQRGYNHLECCRETHQSVLPGNQDRFAPDVLLNHLGLLSAGLTLITHRDSDRAGSKLSERLFECTQPWLVQTDLPCVWVCA